MLILYESLFLSYFEVFSINVDETIIIIVNGLLTYSPQRHINVVNLSLITYALMQRSSINFNSSNKSNGYRQLQDVLITRLIGYPFYNAIDARETEA